MPTMTPAAEIKTGKMIESASLRQGSVSDTIRYCGRDDQSRTGAFGKRAEA